MKLSLKIILIILSVLIVVGSLSSWAFIQKERYLLVQQLRGQGESLAHAVAVLCIETLLSEDYPLLDGFLKTIGSQREDILFIEVFQGGKVVSKYALEDLAGIEFAEFNSKINLSDEDRGILKTIGRVRLCPLRSSTVLKATGTTN